MAAPFRLNVRCSILIHLSGSVPCSVRRYSHERSRKKKPVSVAVSVRRSSHLSRFKPPFSTMSLSMLTEIASFRHGPWASRLKPRCTMRKRGIIAKSMSMPFTRCNRLIAYIRTCIVLYARPRRTPKNA